MDEETIKLIRLLLARLEHISADSVWAHRASGIRGALLNSLEDLENHAPASSKALDAVIDLGMGILRSAAEEKSR